MDITEAKDYISNFRSPKPWTHICVHHSLTEDGLVPDWQAIRNYHMKVNGWHDIGYHFGLEMLGDRLVYQLGRSLDEQGGHCNTKVHGISMNESSIGICAVGNFDKVAPSTTHYFLLASLCRALMERFAIPIQNVVPHWGYADKTCPGRFFDMLRLREQIRG